MSTAKTNRRKFLAAGASLMLAGCNQESYRYKTIKYGWKLYRQYYRKGFEAFGRIRTYELIPSGLPGAPGTWIPSPISVDLGDTIQGRGIEIDEGSLDINVGFDSIGLKPGQVREALISPRRRVYILDIYGDDRVVAFDDVSGTVIAKVSLRQQSPMSMVLSPDRRKLYVLHQQQNAFGTIPFQPPTVIEMDTDPLRVVRRFDLPTSIRPRLTERSIECTADGKFLYILNEGDFQAGAYVGTSIVRLDAATGAILNQISMPVTNSAFGTLRLSPDGDVLYAAHSRGLFFIDVLTNTISLNLTSVGLRVGSIAIHPSGSTLYVPGGTPFGVLAVDTVSATITASIPIPNVREVKNLSISPDGDDLFVNDDQGGKLHHIYLPELRVAASFEHPIDQGVIGFAS